MRRKKRNPDDKITGCGVVDDLLWKLLGRDPEKAPLVLLLLICGYLALAEIVKVTFHPYRSYK